MKRLRKAPNAAADISPEAIGNSRWRTLPRPIAWPSIPHVVGRVTDHHLGELSLQKRFVNLAALGIATDKAMPAELPNVTKLGYRRPFRTKTPQVIGRVSRRGLLRTVYQQVDFPGRKAGELNVEIKFDQILEMAPQ